MVVGTGATLTLKGLTLANGNASNGGALINQGMLNVIDCAFTGNTSSASSGAIFNHSGSAVVTGSTFSGNSAYSAGGAIGNYGSSLTVVNSTFAGNSGGSWGGGALYSRAAALRASTGATLAGDSLGAAGAFIDGPNSPSAASFQVTASTFLSNTATGGGGAIGNGGSGEVGGTATLQNNLFAGSQVGGGSVNCHNEGGTLSDGGYNIEDADTCGFSGTSLKNTNPVLAGLANNGGSTWTIALLAGSPAIDRIPSGVNGCGTTLTTDQRGVHRPLDGNLDGIAACDVGAYEFSHILYLPLIVKNH